MVMFWLDALYNHVHIILVIIYYIYSVYCLSTAIAITIDVISSSDVDSLPVSSTCSQRMSLPLYPSYSILKKKLLQAIQCQAYGLG